MRWVRPGCELANDQYALSKQREHTHTHHAAHFQEEHPRLKLFELSLEYLFKIIPSDTQIMETIENADFLLPG